MPTDFRPFDCFVAGTDTEIGKTFAASALLHAMRARGLRAVAMKPVAAGVEAGDAENDDVRQLIAASNVVAPRAAVNPYLYDEPVAPHIAAQATGRPIELPLIADAYAQLKTLSDAVVVEGVGGFCVPLGPALNAAQLPGALALPVILVVGIRLGCINHALLTVEAIAARGLTLAGWIANCVDPAMSRRDENIATLARLLSAVHLGTIPYMEAPDPSVAAMRLTLPDAFTGAKILQDSSDDPTRRA